MFRKKDEKVTLEALKAIPKTSPSEKVPRRKYSKMTLGSVLSTAFSISLILSAPFIYLLITRLGIGSPFPDQPFLKSSTAVLPPTVLDIAVELPMPPGNVAVSSKGRVFFNYHPEYNPPVKILEMSSRSVKLFPNEAFQKEIMTVLSLRVDSKDRLWLLDYANHGISGTPRLYAFDLRGKDALIQNYTFPSSVAGFGSMLNDFQVDPKGELIYIVDTSFIAATPAIVVYDAIKRMSFRMLESHSSLWGGSHFISITNYSLGIGPLGLRTHVDSVALDRTGQFLYYGALTGDKLYALPTIAMKEEIEYLRSNNLSRRSIGVGAPPATDLEAAVRVVCSEKPMTDGLSIDSAGNIWMTAIEHSALVLALPFKPKNSPSNLPPTFSLVKAVQNEQLLRWPDGLSFGPDGLYVTNSALHYKFAQENMTAKAPYHILRLPLKQLKNKDLYRGRSYSSTPSGH